MSWLSIKAKLWGLGALILAGIGFILRLRVLEHQRDAARERANWAEAEANYRRVKDKKEAEIDQEFSDLEARRKQDVKDGKVPENLRNPNDNW